MAQRVQVLVVCDLHDGDSPAEETVPFSLDGTSYEIDLCQSHAGALREAFAAYVGAARRAGSSTGGRGRGRRRAGGGKSGSRGTEVREWARSQGLKVSERGRIPAEVYEKYDAAHK